MRKLIRQIENNIKNKMIRIESGVITSVESGIGNQFEKLRGLDEPSYEKLIQQYKEILKNNQ